MMGAMGWIIAVVLVALMLPLGAMLYFDILEAKHEVKAEVKRVEQLKRQLEKTQQEQTDDSSRNKR